MKIKTLMGLCACCISHVAFAQCPDNLDTEKLLECITIEGAGANYQDWSKEFYATNSTVSPITGKDIRDIKPAAGPNQK